jgi:hypothetical protein
MIQSLLYFWSDLFEIKNSNRKPPLSLMILQNKIKFTHNKNSASGGLKNNVFLFSGLNLAKW